MLNRIIHRRPIAGLTAKQAAATATFQRARSQGHGIADAVAQARAAAALRQAALQSIRESRLEDAQSEGEMR